MNIQAGSVSKPVPLSIAMERVRVRISRPKAPEASQATSLPQTGKAPTLSLFILEAASSIVASGPITSTLLVMTSVIIIFHFL